MTSLSSDPCNANTGLAFSHFLENSAMARCVIVNVELLPSQQAAPSTMPMRIFCEYASMLESRILWSPGRYMARYWTTAKCRQQLFFKLNILVKTAKQPGSRHLLGDMRVPVQPGGGFLDGVHFGDGLLKNPPRLLGGQRSLKIRHDDPVLGYSFFVGPLQSDGLNTQNKSSSIAQAIRRSTFSFV